LCQQIREKNYVVLEKANEAKTSGRRDNLPSQRPSVNQPISRNCDIAANAAELADIRDQASSE